MKVLLLSGIYNSKIGGLYNSIFNRIIRLNRIEPKGQINLINIVEIDTFLLKVIKKTIKRDSNTDTKGENEEIFHKVIYIKNSLFLNLLKKFFPQMYISYLMKKIDDQLNIAEFDIIHSHWLYPHGSIGKNLAQKYKKKLILTGHGSDVHSIYKKSNFIKKSIQQSLDYASDITLVSKGLRKKLLEIYSVDESKVSIIGNGVDTNLFKPRDSKRQSHNTKKVVGYIGNLNLTKGCDRLPEIFYQVQKEISGVEFLIVGDGELKEQLIDKFKSLGIKVKFTGRIQPTQVPNYLTQLDVLVLPSRNEGFGMVIIEANACGIPCVASNIGGIPDVISDSSLLIEPNEDFEKTISVRIIQLLKNPIDPLILIENAKKYDWNLVINKEYELYKNNIN